MASGTLSVEISWNNGYYYQIDWSSTPNIAGNYSDITCNHYIQCRTALNIGSNTGCYSQVNGGDTKTFTQPAINISSSQRVSIGTTTHRVYHNSDGTKSVTLKGYVNSAFLQYPTISQSITLDTIARASSITSVTSSVAMTGSAACTVAINRKSTSFTHSVKFSFGGYSHTVTGAGTSASYTIPASWNNAIPNSTSGTATVTVTTYSGSTQIGSSVSSTFTVTVPSSVVPSFASLSTSRIDGNVPSAWGIYVQGKSKCELSINGASGSYSSTIKSYSITGSGLSTSSSSGTTGYITDTGTITYTAKTTDSRGRTATKTASITVYAYTAPSATGTAYRANSSGATAPSSGTYIAITPTGAISSCDGHNSKTVQYRYKPVGGDYTSWTTATSGTKITVGGGDISTSYSYLVEVRCSDSFTTSGTYTINIGSGAAMISFYGKTGIAFGKIAGADNLAEFGQPVRFTGGTNAIYLGAGTNLNDITVPNEYYCPVNATVATMSNCPTDYAFSLKVTEHAGYQQTLTTYVNNSSFRTYKRNKYNSSWSSWYTDYTTNNPPSCSAIGALPVSGGTISGNLTVDGDFSANQGSFKVNTYQSDWCNIRSNRPKIWLEKPLYVQGEIYAGSSYSNRVYHTGYNPSLDTLGIYSNLIYSGNSTTTATATVTYDFYLFLVEVQLDGTGTVVAAVSKEGLSRTYQVATDAAYMRFYATKSGSAFQVQKEAGTGSIVRMYGIL